MAPMMTAQLPIQHVLPQLLSELKNSNKVILQAEPGAGKTTLVPLSLMDEEWMEGKRLIMLSPRRVAARAAASRMADLLGENVGERIGYQIRSEKKISSRTKIVVVTEGILTRWLQHDPTLKDTELIIFDEFHERNVHADLSLAFALQSQEYLREDLKILVMSATLDTRGLSTILDNPPIITSEGRCFSVDIIYRVPNSVAIDARNVVKETFQVIKTVLNADQGDILVFLHGEREIMELATLVETYRIQCDLPLLIAPLYGNLSKDEQERAIAPSALRKIIIATNIAETSLTIDGVRIVIDSGLERVSRFDPASGMERLITQKISRASAEQRAGRAGRTAKGKCYRLWSETAHFSLAPHRDPEIRVCDLTPLSLELSVWGAHADDLHWIDPPPAAPLSHAEQLLHSLSAVDHKGDATAHGRSMLALGIHPRLAHMILRAKEMKYESEAILLSAILIERDIFTGTGQRSSDIRERFWSVQQHIKGSQRHTSGMVFPVIQTAREIAGRIGYRIHFKADFDEYDIGVLLSLAFPDRIAKARSSKGRYLTSSGKEVYLHEKDECITSEWLVVARSDGHDTMAKIHLCAPISIERLESLAPEAFTIEQTVAFNNETMRVESREIRRMGEIIIASRPLPLPSTEQVKSALIEGIRICGQEALHWSDSAKALLNRLRACSHHRPEILATDFSERTLLKSLEIWLMPHLTSQSSIRECEALKLDTILSSHLTWDQVQMLDRLFPAYFTAPTGSKIAIDYSDPESPVLAVRVQEMFGLSTHPAILDGSLPLLVHLLSPAHRPIQMTRDLVGFWSGSYSEVKKELKGRYPKHFWPDNPMTAQATNRTKKFMDS